MDSHTCKYYINKLKRNCRKTRHKDQDYCICHLRNVQHELMYEKPSDCCVCFESLDDMEISLPCGHWSHYSCIIRSGKPLCPICRSAVFLFKHEQQLCDSYKKELDDNIAIAIFDIGELEDFDIFDIENFNNNYVISRQLLQTFINSVGLNNLYDIIAELPSNNIDDIPLEDNARTNNIEDLPSHVLEDYLSNYVDMYFAIVG